MGKTTTSKKREDLSQKHKIKLKLEDFETSKRIHPLKELSNPNQTAAAVFECLTNNDPEGAMEMIELYLEAINKTSLMKKTHLPKSTMYSALKHRNPTIKTLARIMYSASH
jgi:DNA-binding phage protein